MVTTRLEIIGTDQATVTNIPISTNYVQADIREPDKRNATFTKTIQLYGTNEVNKLFENIYEANIVTQTFNPNKKTAAKYFVNEIEVLRGDLQLLKIKLSSDNNITYECNIIGSEGSLFVDIGDALLEELDFSAYDHNYTRSNQIASWANAGTGLGYYYGFVHRGFNNGSDTVFRVNDFFPQFFAREYLFKILSLRGYTWTSSFLDSTEFKRLVIEPNISSIALSKSQIDNAQFYVGLNSDLNIPENVEIIGVPFNNESAPFFDGGAQYDSSVAILNTGGNYNIVASINVTLSFTHTIGTVASCTSTNQTLVVKVQKSGDNGANWFDLNVQATLTLAGQGGTMNVNQYYLMNVSVASGAQPFSAGDRFRVVILFVLGNPTYRTGAGTVVTGGIGTFTMTALSGSNGSSFYGLLTSKDIMEGGSILVNNALPKKIKQKDFLKAIMQYGNLYIDVPDKNKPKELVIESYTDYFNGSVVNWENKIDESKDVSVNPISLLDGKKYIFNYKEDKDFYNTKYKTSYSETFGTKTIDVDNDFIKSEKKNELLFSPTPNAANYLLGIAMPKIFKEDPSLGVKSIAPNIRLLYAGGTKQTKNPYTYIQSGQTDLITNDYGYVGHTDDAQTPTLDLNFGTPKEVYYAFIGSSFTTNNAYNRYHRPFIITNTSRDSKVLVAYLWLTPEDISKFSFRNKYFVKDAYYIVNKIVNYNPMVSESTEVELIKVLDLEAFTPVSTLFTDSTEIIRTGGGTEITTLNSSRTSGQSINLGENCLAVGDGIFIPSSARNVTVFGDNVTIAENISNVSVINTNDYEVTTSDVSIVNGTLIPKWQNDFSAIKTIYNNVEITNTCGTVLADATAANISTVLPDAATCYIVDDNGIGIGKKFTITKIDSTANTVTVAAYSRQTINGAATAVLTVQYESITVQSDGTNWILS